MDRKKILFITHEFCYGGIEEYIKSISNLLHKKGHQVFLHHWTHHLGELSKTPDFVSSKKIDYFYDKPLLKRVMVNFFRQSTSLLPFLLQKKPNVIVTNSVKSFFFSLPSLLIAKLLIPQLRVIHQFHGSMSLEIESFEKGLHKEIGKKKKMRIVLYKLAEFLSYKLASEIFVFSHYAKKKILTKYFKVSPQKISRIHPGLTYSVQKKKNAKKTLGLSENVPLITAITRVEPRKGVDKFQKIVQLLKEKSNKKINFMLCSAFEEPILQSSKLLFKNHSQMDLGASIFYVQNPTKKDLNLIYQATDVFIMPSVDLETFGFTTLEALSHETPVACFKIGANQELIKHGYNGFIRPINKVGNLADDILQYLKTSQKTKKTFQESCLETAKTYTWEKYAHKLLN
jgi:glycosyltransferase involved in cell wall biosynthesis